MKVWLDLAWWVVVGFSVLIALLFAVLPLMAQHGNVDTSVKVRVVGAATPPQPYTLPDPGRLHASELVLVEHPASQIQDLELRGLSWRSFVVVNWVVLPALTALLFCVTLLRAFFSDVNAGKVFTATNAGRLSGMAWVVISLGIAGPILQYWRSWIVVARIGPADVTLAPAPLDWDPAVPLFFGLLLFVLAAAWRHGAELQQDRDLTV